MLKPHASITINKTSIEHPLKAGLKKTIGEPAGQIADYEYIFSDGSRVHVREYENVYEIHWDILSPTVDPIGHLICDAPHVPLSILYGMIEGLKEYLHSKDPVKALIESIKTAFLKYLKFRTHKPL